MERKACVKNVINNTFYDELHEKWFEAEDHPVALLRAENRLRIPWILDVIKERFEKKITVLDMGCGGGFLTHALAKKGHITTGIDLSETSLKVARRYDSTKKIQYLLADAYQTPFEDQSFDVVCAMDVLEHVEQPAKLIQEASRLLKKEGLFFFHTFNRTFWSYLLVVKGVEWCVKNTPKHMHVYHLFIKPQEISFLCKEEGLKIQCLRGFGPKIWQKSFFKMLFTRKVSQEFQFQFSSSLTTGYSGFALKNLSH